MNKLLNWAAAGMLALTAVAGAVQAQPAGSDGQVLKIDRAGLRITVRHNGVKNLDMPAMTMAFRIGNPKLLDDLKEGDNVRFSADKVGGSYLIVTLFKTR